MSVLQDVGLLQLVISSALALLIWSFRQAFNQFQKSQEIMTEALANLSQRVTVIETVHELNGCNHVRRDKA